MPVRRTKKESLHTKLHKQHLERLHTTPAFLKIRAPIVPVRLLSGFEKISGDLNVELARLKENNQFLQKINGINRIGGRIQTFSNIEPKLEHKAIYEINQAITRIEMENFKMVKCLKSVKAKVSTFRPITAEAKREMKKKKLQFQVPTNILKKYKDVNLKIPKRVPEQRKLFRPEIYFDMELEGLRKMGRLVMQLYTEAAPQLVYELLLRCVKGQKSSFLVSRLFPKLYLEIDMKLSEHSPLKRELEYDKRALMHDTDIGILSFPEQYLKGFRYGILCFDISFRPLRVLNQKRVAFGRLIKAKRAFNSISEFGTVKGKPTQKIVITGCGML